MLLIKNDSQHSSAIRTVDWACNAEIEAILAMEVAAKGSLCTLTVESKGKLIFDSASCHAKTGIMLGRKIYFPSGLIVIVALAGCGGRDGRDISRPVNDSFNTAESRKCLSELKAQSVRFTVLPNKNLGGGCRTIDTIKVMDLGTEATNLGPMTCPLASKFAAWAKFAVRPAARQFLGSDVVRIETFGTYSCRNVNGGRSGKLSEHAFANAIDISAFVLRDGRRISVLSGWNGKSEEREFLKRLHQSACKRFGTVLGPEYNAQHANHFHFDMSKSMKDGSAYCR